MFGKPFNKFCLGYHLNLTIIITIVITIHHIQSQFCKYTKLN